MFRRVLVAVVVAALALGLSGCIVRRVEIEEPRSESRPIDGFDEVSFSGYGDLTVKEGSRYDVEIRGPQSALDRVKTEVRGDTLYIEWQNGWFSWWQFSDSKLDIVVTTPSITRLELSGAGEVTMDGFSGDEFTFDLSGAGSFDAQDIEFDELLITMSGAGSADVSGVVKSQSVSISGAASYDARDLESRTAEVEMSGAGSATVWAADRLDIELSGAGSVEYYGNPKITQDVSGLGSVQGRGER